MRTPSQVHGPALVGLGLTLVVAGLLPALSDGEPGPAAAAAAAPSPTEPAAEPPADPGSAPPTVTPAEAPSQPEASSPTPEATPEPSAADAVAEEDVVDFYARLTSGLQTADVPTLFDLLHPAVLDRYGAEQCRDYLADAGDESISIEVLGMDAPAPWTWELDGVSTEIAPAIAVTIRLSVGDASVEQEAHLAVADGALRWFTDCGDPAS